MNWVIMKERNYSSFFIILFFFLSLVMNKKCLFRGKIYFLRLFRHYLKLSNDKMKADFESLMDTS